MVLTGGKAARRAEEHYLVDANGMREIWRDLDQCWQELESMLSSVPEGEKARFEVSQYIHGWQVSSDLYFSFLPEFSYPCLDIHLRMS